MSNHPVDSEIRLKVMDLASLPPALIHVLGEAGIGGQQMDRIFSESIHAECVGCGIRLSIQDLMPLTPSWGGEKSQKLERVRLGYCARNTCDSQFYAVRTGFNPGMDSGLLLGRLKETLANPDKWNVANETPAEPRIHPYAKFRRQAMMVAGAIVLTALGIRWWWNGAYVPGISRKPQVFIAVEEPANRPVSHEPAGSRNPPPAQPRERVFRAQ